MNLSSEKAVGSSDAGLTSSLERGLPARSGESSDSFSCVSNIDTYEDADSETMSLTNRSSSSAPFFTEGSESDASYKNQQSAAKRKLDFVLWRVNQISC